MATVLLPDGRLHPGSACAGAVPRQPTSAAEGAARARSFVATKWISPDAILPLAQGPSLGMDVVPNERARTLSISGMAFQDAWTSIWNDCATAEAYRQPRWKTIPSAPIT